MANRDTGQPKKNSPVIWALVSVAIPIIAVAVGFLVVAGASKGVGGDLIGTVYLIYAEVGVGIASICGAAAAVYSIMKREDYLTLASVGLLLNLVFIAYGALVGRMLLR